MPRPARNKTTKTRGLAGTRGPERKWWTQRKVWISSAVSNTAGTTVENEIVQSRLNSTGLNSSRPRYCQLAVRRLISSNNHQTGAEKQKSSTNLFRERDQRELPARLQTKASTTKIYPSQSGKNRTEVRRPWSIQLSGQQTAINSSPTQPRAGQGRFNRIISEYAARRLMPLLGRRSADFTCYFFWRFASSFYRPEVWTYFTLTWRFTFSSPSGRGLR